MKIGKLLALARITLLSAMAAASASVSAMGITDEIYNVSVVEKRTISDTQQVITLSLGTRTEEVVVTPNPTFRHLQVVDQHGQRISSATETYTGYINGLPRSWVRLAITGDAVHGALDTGSARTLISSDAAPDPFLANSHRHIRQLGPPTDVIVHAPASQSSDRTIREVVQIPVGGGFPATGDQQVTRVARIAIVVDSLYDEALGGRGLAQAISTINTVDGIYQQEFGLALKADSAIMITDEETLHLGRVSLEENLALFRDYRQNAPELPADLALVHLFTGARTDDSSVGLAYIGAACRDDGYDVSMATPFLFPVLLTAHEIGHNLGAPHDDDTELCSLSDELLMHSQISDITTEAFSICSANAINGHLEQNTCYLAAIDLSLTLTRDGETDLIAVVTNTDTQRAFPSARLSIRLKNANIASAPASCEIESTTEVICIVPTTLPEDNQSLKFAVRIDGELENTIDGTLEAIDFIDIKTINNYAQIVVPAQTPDDNDTHNIASNDPGNNLDDDEPPADTGAGSDTTATAAAGGGGTAGLWSLLLAGVAVSRTRYSRSKLTLS